MRRLPALLAMSATLLSGTVVSAPSAWAVDPWQQTVDITFPTEPDKVTFGDSYAACRSGCSRTHQAADLMGPKMTRLFSTVDGVVCSLDEGAEDSYGRHITICGDDGNRYRYLHLNNDTPGTDDGAAGLEHVYAPRIRRGVRVARGQHIAYMGDSGNAEGTAPHLHFDLYVPGVSNPWGEERINPYHSLKAALARGDIADGTALAVEHNKRVSGPDRVETAVAVSRGTFDDARAAVLATASTPHDALVGGPLAAMLGGPVLITGPGAVAPPVLAELERLGVEQVVLVGAVSVLRAEVERLLPDATVEVVAGEDVYATAALVAERVWTLTGAVAATSPDGADEQPEVALPVADELVLPPLEVDLVRPVVGTPTLVLLLDGNRQGTYGALDGAHLPASFERLHVQLVGVDPKLVEAVSFHAGDRAGRRNKINTEKRFPYDLGGTGDEGPSGVSPWWRDAGEQALTARIRWADGSTQEVSATFGVGQAPDRDGSDRPDRRPTRRAILALGGGIAEHRSWPDALSASWYGAVRELPVLLTRPGDTPGVTAAAVATLADLVVAGGPGAISEAQVATLASSVAAGSARRLAGPDRYATAAAIAQDLVERRLVDESTVVVATGQNWPDAVAAGPAVAADRNVLLLVDGAAGDSPTARDAVVRRADAVGSVLVLGGRNAVSDTTLRKVAGWAL